MKWLIGIVIAYIVWRDFLPAVQQAQGGGNVCIPPVKFKGPPIHPFPHVCGPQCSPPAGNYGPGPYGNPPAPCPCMSGPMCPQRLISLQQQGTISYSALRGYNGNGPKGGTQRMVRQ